MSGKNVATERHEPQLDLAAIAFGARNGAAGAIGRAEALECLPSAAGRARRLVTEVLRAWDLDELCGDARQIVTELVANVVTHTNCSSFRLDVLRAVGGGVRIAVSDGSRTTPVPRCPRDGAESGRGLLLIEALSSRWGCDRRHGGKTVWAELGNPGEGTCDG
ncbi:ATP-binding protein [Streptomyces uncialis]|uniref:ATP-binding protein n=1 Tax=Streptomyces uncialis TaxID=1048205 RepID=UPI002E366662|nr:ATP-binding protein [Streptomyces uncialis]